MYKIKYLFLVVLLFLYCTDSNKTAIELYCSDGKMTCVTFTNSDSGSYIGYRIVEHEPEIHNQLCSDYLNQPVRGHYDVPAMDDTLIADFTVPKETYKQGWVKQYRDEKKICKIYRNGVLYFRYEENPGLYRFVVLKAVPDGIDIWAWLESEYEITGSYIVQSCFRLSGDTNSKWRHTIACVPELSEYDLWAKGDSTSLTYIIQNGSYFKITDKKEKIKFTTEALIPFWDSQNIKPERKYIVPHGLIMRESPDKKNVAGMYWERTAYVACHYPADCLHSYIDLGPVKPGNKNIIHGKFYWFNGDKEDLLDHWQKDFPRKGIEKM